MLLFRSVLTLIAPAFTTPAGSLVELDRECATGAGFLNADTGCAYMHRLRSAGLCARRRAVPPAASSFIDPFAGRGAVCDRVAARQSLGAAGPARSGACVESLR